MYVERERPVGTHAVFGVRCRHTYTRSSPHYVFVSMPAGSPKAGGEGACRPGLRESGFLFRVDALNYFSHSGVQDSKVGHGYCRMRPIGVLTRMCTYMPCCSFQMELRRPLFGHGSCLMTRMCAYEVTAQFVISSWIDTAQHPCRVGPSRRGPMLLPRRDQPAPFVFASPRAFYL